MLNSNTATIIKKSSVYEKLSGFFYGRYYPIYLAAFAALFYIAKTPVLGLAVFVAIAVVTLLSFRDLIPFMPLPMLIMQCMSDLKFFSNPLAIILIAIAGVALIVHLIIYRIEKFKFGSLFLPIVLISIALFSGGLFSPYLSSYVNGLGSSLSVGVLTLVVYVLFTNYYNPPKNFNYKEHFLYYLAVCGTLIALEIIYHRYDVFYNGAPNSDMGYGNTNIVGAAMLITIPAVCYFLAKAKKCFIFLICLIISYIGVYLSKSDGAFALSILCLPVLIIITYRNSNSKRRAWLIKSGLIICALFIVCLMIYGTKHDILSDALKYLKTFETDSGRTPLFLKALDLFSKYPIFGVGLGYRDNLVPNPSLDGHIIAFIYNFHSTFFHVIATMGIVGLAAYTIYYIARYKILMKNCTFYHVTAYLCFSIMQCYGMVDACEFHALPLLMFCTLLLITTEKVNQEKSLELLPLTDFKEF